MTREEAIEILNEDSCVDCACANMSYAKCKYEGNCDIRTAMNMAIEALKAETSEDCVSRKHLLSGIDELMQSPWFNRYKDDGGTLHFGYTERKEAVEIVRDLCVKAEPPVTPKPAVLEDIKLELWDSGMNMGGEYQGVWVRYRDIEKIINKHISGGEQK